VFGRKPGGRISHWSGSGLTQIRFYNGANPPALLTTSQVNWNTNVNVYAADPQLSSLAPAGTATFEIRYVLSAPNSLVDMDMLRVHTDP
jgi:hypothetical protein